MRYPGAGPFSLQSLPTDGNLAFGGIGVLALTFRQGESAESPGLTDREMYRIEGLTSGARGATVADEDASGLYGADADRYTQGVGAQQARGGP